MHEIDMFKPEKRNLRNIGRGCHGASERRTAYEFILYSVVRDLKLYCVKLIKTARRSWQWEWGNETKWSLLS